MYKLATLNRLAFVGLLALASVAGTTACSSTVPVEEQIDDATITTHVKSRLAADPDVAAHNIDVDTNEGVVTLSGRVDDGSERAEAEKLARETKGVKRVVNNLKAGDLT